MTLDHFEAIYARRAAEYHAMIAAEDRTGNLVPALEGITSFQGKRLLDLGTGTGRMPLLFSDRASSITGLDISRAMLLENQVQRQRAGGRWHLVQGNLRHLPIPNEWADITMAAWTIGHLRSWFRSDWQTTIGQALEEMIRVTRRRGFVILIETLGTGSSVPTAPNRELAEFYDWLEDELGFSPQEVRTDYQFASVEEAVAGTEFFFGSALASQIRENQWTRIREWTGIWSLRAGSRLER